MCTFAVLAIGSGLAAPLRGNGLSQFIGAVAFDTGLATLSAQVRFSIFSGPVMADLMGYALLHHTVAGHEEGKPAPAFAGRPT